VAERSPAAGQAPATGEEPGVADVPTAGPRAPTRALVVTALVLVVLLAVSAVVAAVLLHQPRLTPVPVPSVSAIA